MAANIFEIVIGSGYAATQTVFTDVNLLNGDFLLHAPESSQAFFGTNPSFWNRVGFTEYYPESSVVTPLNLFAEDFPAYPPSYQDLYENTELAHTSFYYHQGWIIRNFLIGNNGLNVAGTDEVESAATTGYPYFNAESTLNGGELAPDLTLYGRSLSNSTLIPDRVGTFASVYLPDVQSTTYPSAISKKNERSYLTNVNHAEDYNLYGFSYNYGSLNSDNEIIGGAKQTTSLSNIGTSNQVYKVLSQGAGVHSQYLSYNFLLFNQHIKSAIIVYNALGANFDGKVKYIGHEGKFPANEDSSYINPYTSLPPITTTFKNIFPSYLFGKTVTLQITAKYHSQNSVETPLIPFAYTRNLSPTGGVDNYSKYWTHIGSAVTEYTVNSSSSVTSADGFFFPKPPFSGDFYNGVSDSDSGAMIRFQAVTDGTYSGTVLVVDNQNPQDAFLTARCSVDVIAADPEKGKTYNYSINFRKSVGNNIIRFFYEDNSGVEHVITSIQIPLIGDIITTQNQIVKGSFNVPTTLDISKVYIDVVSEDYIEINYVRISLSTYCFKSVGLQKDHEGNVLESQNWGASMGSNHDSNESRLVVTSSPLTTLPFALAREHNNASHHAKEYVWEVEGQPAQNPNFDTQAEGVTNVKSIVLPFHGNNGVYNDGGRLNDDETQYINPKNIEIYDADGFPLYNGTSNIATSRKTTITIKVGCPNLSIFMDDRNDDEHVDSAYSIESVAFLDARTNYSSVDATNTGKLYYRTDAILPSGLATKGLTPIVTQATPLGTPFGEDVTVEVKVDSFSGDGLVIDTGSGTPRQLISSSGINTISLEVQGNNLRLRALTEEEKGSAVVDTTLIIDYVRVSYGITGDAIHRIIEKYGDETTDNSNNSLIDPYQAAVRIKNFNFNPSVNNLHLGTVNEGELYLRNANVPYQLLSNKDIVNIVIKVPYMGANNKVKITHTAFSDLVISSAGTYTMQAFNTGDLDVYSANLYIYFYTNGDALLDVVLDSVKILYKDSEPTGQNADISLDLFESFDVPITSSIRDFRDMTSGSSSYSKTLTIPATSKNKLAFNFENEINSISNKFNSTLNSPIRFNLKAEGISVFNGYANLLGSSLNEDGTNELEINLVSGNSDWVELVKNIDLKSLPSSSVLINTNNVITGQRFINNNTDIFFPLVDNGKWKQRDSANPDATNVGWKNLKAAFPLIRVLTKIFDEVGYKISSNFFNSNSEFDSDFSSDFLSFKDRLIGIAPLMSKPDYYIQDTEIDLSFDSSLSTGAGIHTQASAFNGVESQARPFLQSSYFSTTFLANFPIDLVDTGYYIDWAYIRFNKINIDSFSSHSYSNISSTDLLKGVSQESNPQKYKLKGNTISSGNEKSFISVGISGYYEIESAINFNLVSTSDNNTFVATGAITEEEDHFAAKMTVLLVDEDFALDNTYRFNSNESFGFNAFDLFDENSLEFINTEYENTRTSISRVQYLEAGKQYNAVVLMGIVGITSENEYFNNNVYTSSFIINELDLRMILSKNPAPMEGRYNVVYDSVATPRVGYLDVLPDVKAIDFISELTKIFNLSWSTNQLTKEISVEPFNSFYDFSGELYGYNDFTDKALITKVTNNAILSSNTSYKMADDSGDYSVSSDTSGAVGVTFGDKVIDFNRSGLNQIGNINDSENSGVQLDIFSALKMGRAKFIARTTEGLIGQDILAQTDNLKTNTIWLPRIWSEPESTLEPTIPEEKPNPNNSHEYKLAYIRGLKSTDAVFDDADDYASADALINSSSTPCVYYSLEERFLNENLSGDSQGVFRYDEIPCNFYLEAGSYFPFDNSSPSTTFSDITSASDSELGLFNTYHQGLVDMLVMRDKIITAEVMLTSSDVRNINFRQLVSIGEELYIINKIKDFNFSGEPTEVELLLVTRTGTNSQIL